LLKIERPKIDFLKQLKNFKEFVGTYITFLKGYDASFPKNFKLSMIYNFEKKFGGGLLCTRGAAGIWAMHIFSSTYFGEISIFGLSKDPATRN
jgi:hypothetical protein